MTKPGFDPDDYRMTMGEHLEELRYRLILAIGGMLAMAGVCLFFGEKVFTIFCRPLIHELAAEHLSTQLYYDELGQPFMVYIKVSLVCAAVFAGPWMLFQLWQFVAAGLYPAERKYITKYVPLSIGLLISGFLFVYFIILPWTIVFFLKFGNSVALPREQPSRFATTQPNTPVMIIPVINGDWPNPVRGQMWFNQDEERLKLFLNKDDMRVIPFGPSNLLSPHISLPEYIDLVLTTLLTFGLCFQLPLVVLALAKIGIVDVKQLRSFRRYVYFGLAVVAATMTPGDVVTAMLALMAPLVLLYELGILLAVWGGRGVEDRG
jgi:sec-independent protein translocase protein TatC